MEERRHLQRRLSGSKHEWGGKIAMGRCWMKEKGRGKTHKEGKGEKSEQKG